MRFINILGLAAVAAAAAIPESDSEPPLDISSLVPAEEYTIERSPEPENGTLPFELGNLGWEGSVTPGGPVQTWWGKDLDDIEAKIQLQYPDFSIYGDENVDETSDVYDDPANRAEMSLLSSGQNCRSFGGAAAMGDVNDSLIALKKVKGNSCKAPARTCVRLKWKNLGAVGMCNDNRYEINVKCTDAANMAHRIRVDCSKFDTVYIWPGKLQIIDHRTYGQIFSAGGSWNVIIGTYKYFGDSGRRPV